MNKHWNKRWFVIHRVAGLLAGAFLLMISLSGALLVFSDEIDHALHNNLWHVKPGAQRKPLNELLQTARQSVTGNPYLYFLRLPQQANQSLVMRAEYSQDHKTYLYLDPYTGQVLGQRRNTGYFMGWLLYFHFSLMGGKTGAQIILVVGVLFALSFITGLWIYRHSLGKVLAFRQPLEWGNRKRRWRNLHRIAGVWSLLFNLLIIVTGIFMEVAVIDARKGNKPFAAYQGPVEHSYDSLLLKAQQQLPGLQAMGIRLPKKAGDPVRVMGHAGEAPVWGEYSSSVFFNDSTGAVIKVADFKTATPAARFKACLAPLHFGNYGGIPLKIVYCLFGLAPALLSVSGFLIWYRRKYIIKRTSRQQRYKMAG